MFKNYYTIAVRFLAKNKIYASINVFGLVVGFTSFILITLFLTDELTYDHSPHSDRLYRIVNTAPENDPWLKGVPQMPVQLINEVPEIESMTRLLMVNGLVQNNNKVYEEKNVLFADPSFIKLFPLSPLRGSYSFLNENSVVITKQTAERYFGEADPLGKSIRFTMADDTVATLFEVSGVIDDLPSNIHFHFDFLMPYRENMAFQNNTGVYTYLQLKPHTNPNDIEKKFSLLNQTHHEAWRTDQSQAIILQAIESIHLDSHFGEEMEKNGNRQVLYILGISAFLILIVGLINFINISLARSIKRAKEIGIRKVMGAQRSQVAGQFLLESLTLLVIAAILAVGVTQVLLPLFNAFTSKSIAPQLYEYLPILGLIILISGILASAYPALLLSGVLPAVVLKDASAHQFFKGTRLRSALLVAQFSIAITLLIATITIWNQLNFIQSKDLGFTKDQVLLLRLDNPQSQRNYTTVKQQVQRYTGIVQVAASGAAPGQDFSGWPYQLPVSSSYTGEPISLGTTTLFVDEAYLGLMKIPVLKGRAFDAENLLSDSEFGVLVNESFVSEYNWDMENALGKTIQYFNPAARAFVDANVIGVVKDFHYQSFHSKIEPLIIRLKNPNDGRYGSVAAMNTLSLELSGSEFSTVLASLKQAWKDIDPVYPFHFEFLDDRIQKQYENDERLCELFLMFSVIAIAITCLGLLGISLLTIEQRTKELGIRKILGAST
ncbi:MAG: ABC transporter permease, partial [Cyclobacteriaceae bacterium]|nr:ABC transporter permease [Cyclobacteriaceae bacterium]